jgi:hypothetical protein
LTTILSISPNPDIPLAVSAAYLSVVGLPLVVSSQHLLVVLGAIVIVGCVAAYSFYWVEFISVWCFFAAATSSLIFLYFEQTRMRRG